MANETALADHLLTIEYVGNSTFDYTGENPELVALSDAIHALSGGDFDTLVKEARILDDSLIDKIQKRGNLSRDQAEALLHIVLDGIDSALCETDWRLGYGKIRPYASIPEAAAHLCRSAVDLVRDATSPGGMRKYRNRHFAFVAAMAEFAERANGGLRANMTFYQRLGEQVARVVLDHKITTHEPKLAPISIDYESITQAAFEQLVYFIRVGDDGPIKIGIARDPKARLSGLQTGHHETLNMLALTVGGAEQERLYHRQFRDHHLRGEWFKPHPDILAEIERVNLSPTPSTTPPASANPARCQTGAAIRQSIPTR